MVCDCLRRLMRPQEAYAACKEALAWAERMGRGDSMHMVGLLRVKATRLLEVGRAEEAVTVLERANDMEKRSNGRWVFAML
eukprot:16886-Eustigmatos_ZCMA.PRE.1